MSTFYASFASLGLAQSAVHELVDGGVDPDDLSLVSCTPSGVIGEMHEIGGTVGDATAFVGRSDDPSRTTAAPTGFDYSELSNAQMSRISPIDTSNRDTDVETVDQMEDSQDEFEREITGGISQGAHEMDDVSLTLLTGFPTAVPVIEESEPGDFAMQDQLDDRIETLEIPGFGVITGGGLLATAALDLVNEKGRCTIAAIIAQLKDDGVPEDIAEELQSAFQGGKAILAVVVTPGEIDEDAVEEIAERNGGHNYGLFDAPRF